MKKKKTRKKNNVQITRKHGKWHVNKAKAISAKL